MEEALKEADAARQVDEVPIGCVIVKDNKIIARAHNEKVMRNCVIDHAETIAIRKASEALGTWHLDGCDMYVTLEPCIMCTGAIVQSRIRKVYFAARDPKGGALGSNVDITKIEGLNHYPQYESMDKEESSQMLKTFFRNKRIKK